MSPPTLRTIGVLALIGALVLSTGAVAIASAGETGQSEDAVKQIGHQQIDVSDVAINVDDTHIDGPGLPDATLDGDTYLIEESTTTIKGLTVTYNGQTYEICCITVTVDNVGLTFDNVTIGDG